MLTSAPSSAPIVSSYHYVLGPIVAFAALGLIVLICRWVFSTTTRDRRAAQRAAMAGRTGDYGLLVPVAATLDAASAERLRLSLRAAGIRGTVAAGAGTGQLLVLVFRADEAAARDVVSSSA